MGCDGVIDAWFKRMNGEITQLFLGIQKDVLWMCFLRQKGGGEGLPWASVTCQEMAEMEGWEGRLGVAVSCQENAEIVWEEVMLEAAVCCRWLPDYLQFKSASRSSSPLCNNATRSSLLEGSTISGEYASVRLRPHEGELKNAFLQSINHLRHKALQWALFLVHVVNMPWFSFAKVDVQTLG